ncbi:hypothetical protein D917_03581 [Trichinella nativa]|uniref:CCHC-type domain-containing protein n=1 Tax=Trichinella nativa TaxID=6335 RepID=A0A1Y3EDG4_9BILA|nr:hypothetical protein D917_03581 [Trichinella nativa]
MRAVDVVPGSIRSAEADRNIRLPQYALPKFDGKRKDAVLTAADYLIMVARELLPEQTRIKWDEITMEYELAQSDLSQFMQFLRNQAELMQQNRRKSLPVIGRKSSSVARTPQKITHLGRHVKTATHLQASAIDCCLVCRGSHHTSDCPVIWKSTHGRRRALVRKAGLCFQCLKSGHVARECCRFGDDKTKSGNGGEPRTLRSSEMPFDTLLEKDQKLREVNPVNVNLASQNKSGRTRLQII